MSGLKDIGLQDISESDELLINAFKLLVASKTTKKGKPYFMISESAVNDFVWSLAHGIQTATSRSWAKVCAQCPYKLNQEKTQLPIGRVSNRTN